jgi:hypothetical protein
MNPQQSFTLCPSTSDNENGVIPGTIRKDWRTTNDRRFDICPEAGLGIRAAPFELAVSDRDLPRSGTITPLDSHEYRAWVESRQGKPLSCTFPTTPNPFEEQNHLEEEENGDSLWKQRYLESEMSRKESRLAVLYLLEERRRMQLRMLSLEEQLHEARSQQQRTNGAQGESDFPVEETNETLANDDEGNSGVDHSGAPAADKIASNDENDAVVKEDSPSEKEATDTSVRMTRSRLRREETASEENASSSLITPSKETASKADETCGTDDKRKQASKKSSSDEVPNVQKAETPCATTREKRKRDMKANPTDASQDDEPAKRQTRARRTKG